MSILSECPFCRRAQANRNKVCRECGGDLNGAKRSKKVVYCIDYRDRHGKQRREYVGTSIEHARNIQAERRDQKRKNKLPVADISFDDLTKWFLPIEKIKIQSEENTPEYFAVKEIHLKSFNAIYGETLIRNFMDADLRRYKAERKQKGLSKSYIDQEVGTVKLMISTAFNNRKVDGEALRVFNNYKPLMKKKTENRRTRVLSSDEYNQLRDKLASHVVPIWMMAFSTGMRSREILSLTWDRVDLAHRMIRLEASDTKTSKARNVPISKPLRTVLMELPSRLRSRHVFEYRGRPIKDIREALMTAADKASISYGRKVRNGFTFHDLRRTFKTNLRKAGIDRNVRNTILGHESQDMDNRYDVIDDEDLIKAIDQLELFLANVDQSVDQEQKNDSPKRAENDVTF